MAAGVWKPCAGFMSALFLGELDPTRGRYFCSLFPPSFLPNPGLEYFYQVKCDQCKDPDYFGPVEMETTWKCRDGLTLDSKDISFGNAVTIHAKYAVIFEQTTDLLVCISDLNEASRSGEMSFMGVFCLQINPRGIITIHDYDIETFSDIEMPLEKFNVLGPILGFRRWTLGESLLFSEVVSKGWAPGAAMTGNLKDTFPTKFGFFAGLRPIPGGVYSYKHLIDVPHWKFEDRPEDEYVYGGVWLWGEVIEHEIGYRSENAYPAFFLIDEQPVEKLEQLSETYDVPLVGTLDENEIRKLFFLGDCVESIDENLRPL